MQKKITLIDGIIMALLAAMCIAIICGTVFQNSQVVKADDGKDIIPYTRENGSGTRGAFVSMTGLESRNFLGEL
ncbi:MAG: hypothetical protein PHQ72_01065 [Hespellia sp.]|nr:hypothetical protein [Hespellia sp.]